MMATSTIVALLIACIGLTESASAGFLFEGIGALGSLSSAWQKWSSNSATKRECPQIQLDIMEPKIGLKAIPCGMHPNKYLQELPELQNFLISDAEIWYLNSQNGLRFTISNPYDWEAFFASLENRASALHLKLKTESKPQPSLWEKGTQLVQPASEKLRTFGKSLIKEQAVEVKELEKEQENLAKQGFTNFSSRAMVFEELGYDKKDWPDLVSNLVESGLPGVWGKTLIFAAKAKRSGTKSLTTNNYQNGVRTMYYLKLQVLPDGEGGVDGLFAIYELKAAAAAEKTGIKVEQSFKRFVELDAHQGWKNFNQRGQTFLPDAEGSPPAEL